MENRPEYSDQAYFTLSAAQLVEGVLERDIVSFFSLFAIMKGLL